MKKKKKVLMEKVCRHNLEKCIGTPFLLIIWSYFLQSLGHPVSKILNCAYFLIPLFFIFLFYLKNRLNKSYFDRILESWCMTMHKFPNPYNLRYRWRRRMKEETEREKYSYMHIISGQTNMCSFSKPTISLQTGEKSPNRTYPSRI